jgi:hypothetical protein
MLALSFARGLVQRKGCALKGRASAMNEGSSAYSDMTLVISGLGV